MIQIYPVEADTSNINVAAINNHEHTTLLLKQLRASKGCYINKTFILYIIHRHKIHKQSIFPRFFIFVFNLKIDSPYLID